MLWSNLIDVLRGSLFVLSHWLGGSFGGAILVASAAMRIALLPITLPATRRRLVRERKMRELAPKLADLKRLHDGKPEALFAATQRLHDAHGVPMLDSRGMRDALVALPPAAALYSAVRGAAERVGGFLWVGDLAKPDRGLAAVAGAVTAAIAWASMPGPGPKNVSQIIPILVTTAITFLMLSHFSAGVAIYSVSNSVIGAAERAIASRSLRSSTP